jgi:hypothetical protein
LLVTRLVWLPWTVALLEMKVPDVGAVTVT